MTGPIIEVPAPATLRFPSSRVIVTTENFAATLGGVIDSTVLYVVDGVEVCGGVSIEVPATGLFMSGQDVGVSTLTCSKAGFTLFTSPAGGSGQVSARDLTLTVDGVGSQLYDLEDVDGTHIVNLRDVRLKDCSSLGTLDGYAQCVETRTERVGGKPELTLEGHWAGGYSLTSSVARKMVDGAYSLFKAGAGFTMTTRFLTDIVCDLPASAALIDFVSGVFVEDLAGNAPTLQIQNALVSRNGVFDAADPNIIPGLDQTLIICKWTSNKGLSNTFEGGRQYVSAEAATVITTATVFETLLATWAASNIEHFDSPAPGQLRHLGATPREYKVTTNFVMDSTANNQLAIRLRKWDASAAAFVDAPAVVRQVNQLAGIRDVAIFNFAQFVLLDQSDYVFWQVANNTGTANINLELDSDWFVEAR